MLPLLQALAANGLNLIASAVMTKGKEVVEDKLGVKLDENISPEKALELKQLEFDHEEALRSFSLEERKLELDAEKSANEAVTRRWEADLHSDSWLSKNIRPSVLIYLLVSYTILSLMSAFGLNVNESYVALLGQWGILVMTAYFGGRTVEKIMNVKEANK